MRNLFYIALLCAFSNIPLKGQAQVSLDSYFNVDWQFKIPLDNNFSNDASGWGWYYPYSFSYSYSTGSIIGELVDTNAPTPLNDKLTVVWNTYICGLLNGNNLSLSRTMEAIAQAFEQSPYLQQGNNGK